jgi:hypothetical protein
VKRMLESERRTLAGDQDWIRQRRTQLSQAQAKLDAAFKDLSR